MIPGGGRKAVPAGAITVASLDGSFLGVRAGDVTLEECAGDEAVTCIVGFWPLLPIGIGVLAMICVGWVICWVGDDC